MEKFVDSDYPETQYDSSQSSETWTDLLSNNSRTNQSKNKSKERAKISRTRKKIAGENQSVGRPNPGKSPANFRRDKSVREDGKRVTKLNVLKSRLTSARRSVQNNTKILHRNVPDRIGKYVNSSVRRGETKSFSDQGTKAESGFNDGYALNDCPDTKLNMIGNECLSNEESVALGNSIVSDLGTKNIFEKIFDDCLGSTSVVKDASSRETLNLEAVDRSVTVNPETVKKYTRLLENFENFKKDDARMIQNEKTPKKIGDRPRETPPNTPIKVKDHSNYYSHKKIRHVCDYCHKIFKSNGKLNSHVYSHTGERPFDCNNCGKAFSSKFKLVRHLLIHSEIRKFVCQICDRTFLRNDHLKNHYKIHDPQKKMYKCPKEHCDKEYSSMMSHKKHMAYHSVEDGDLKCLICNVKFETKEEVLFHLKSHSGSRLFKSQSDKKFKCDFCDRLFLTRKDVTRHLVVHTGERDFLCQFCPQRFGRKDHLVRHIKKSHVNDGITVKNEIKQLIDEKKTETCVPAPVSKPSSPIPTSSSQLESRKEDEIGDEETEKPRIVITVKNPVSKKKSESVSKNKSFRKNASVPNRKQVPLSKNKSSTTQIFLQNIPNILIIPNNSIILLRNQTSSNGKGKKTDESEGDESGGNGNMSNSAPMSSTTEDQFQFAENFPPGTRPVSEETNANIDSNSNFSLNYNYMYQQPQFPMNFPYTGEAFSNYQPEVTPAFGQQFDSLSFEMMLPQRPDGGTIPVVEDLPDEVSSKAIESGQTGDMTRKVGIVKPMTKTLENTCSMEKDLFEETSEMISDSILNDFKVDDSVILDSDAGILNNLFDQSGVDPTGNELLRNLLMSENPMLSPLPGFSQIFHNSNAN